MIKPQSVSTVESADEPTQSVATGVYICVHGHFYQPPRENPSLDAVGRQPSAAPFHDWNERILHESYRPNAFARILNDRGEVVRIVNNYEYISFNIGPTLMSWLERHDLETYQRILEADRRAAIAIWVMAMRSLKSITTSFCRWLIIAIKSPKFAGESLTFSGGLAAILKGMWLAETAVDHDTPEVLISEGIQFIVLAPSQAHAVGALAGPMAMMSGSR